MTYTRTRFGHFASKRTDSSEEKSFNLRTRSCNSRLKPCETRSRNWVSSATKSLLLMLGFRSEAERRWRVSRSIQAWISAATRERECVERGAREEGSEALRVVEGVDEGWGSGSGRREWRKPKWKRREWGLDWGLGFLVVRNTIVEVSGQEWERRVPIS